MPIKQHFSQIGQSPAWLIDLPQVEANMRGATVLRELSDCRVLYSIKALPLVAVVQRVAALVDGYSVSSWFEAQLARDSVTDLPLHLCTPGLRSDHMPYYAQLCSHISFNSLNQYRQLSSLAGAASLGMRVNPKLSFADDIRYDPCRPASKLGTDWRELLENLPPGVQGLHVHHVFSRSDAEPMLQTVPQMIEPLLQRHDGIRWLNLGGGYLYQDMPDLKRMADLLRYLREQYQLQIIVEPGKAIVNNAAYLVCTVLDRFESDGQTVLLLDSSVNHHPEVFEYQRAPRLLNADQQGDYVAWVAGCSCLAGDVFGRYRFRQLPEIGERLIFADIGAYSLSKAQRFNGINLPAIYLADGEQLSLYQRFDYQDYAGLWRGNSA
jgi:carboxynorspermidine decarboxylase